MGKGYYILVWDEWGIGLNMINPRLHTEGIGMDGHRVNWFPAKDDLTEEDIINKHNLKNLYNYFKIIF